MALRLDPDDDELVEAHEINVTPFIDVMLVLLIIFMVTAPLATVDVRVDLPVSTAQQQPQPQKPLYLTLQKDGTLLLADRTVTRAELPAALDEASNDAPDARVFLRADKAVAYGDLMSVMNILRGAGYFKIALVGLDASAMQ